MVVEEVILAWICISPLQTAASTPIKIENQA